MSEFKIPQLMGILNITPDSFSGDGILEQKNIIRKAEELLSEGADILDIGAESSRPDSSPLTAKEELARLLPVIKDLISLTKNISIDTYHLETAAEILSIAPVKINSIKGIKHDLRLAELVAREQTQIFIMHNTSDQAEVINDPKLGSFFESQNSTDIIEIIKTDLHAQITQAKEHGIKSSQIVIDPGLGFGKTPIENLRIIKETKSIKALGYPVLIGASRKSFLGLAAKLPAEERLAGSLAAALIATLNGADYLRIHDVLETKKHLELAQQIYQA